MSLFFTYTGVVPSAVVSVCQAGDELELTCNTSGIAHRWEFTVFPENMTYTTTPITSVGTSTTDNQHLHDHFFKTL